MADKASSSSTPVTTYVRRPPPTTPSNTSTQPTPLHAVDKDALMVELAVKGMELRELKMQVGMLVSRLGWKLSDKGTSDLLNGEGCIFPPLESPLWRLIKCHEYYLEWKLEQERYEILEADEEEEKRQQKGEGYSDSSYGYSD